MVYPWSPLGPRWLSKDGSHQNFQATSSTLEHTNHMQNIPLASRVSSLPFGGSEYAERNIPQAPSLPFAGHDRITSIFPRWTHRHAKPDQQTWENATDTKTTRSSAGLCLQAPHYETKRTKVMMDTWGYKEVSSLGEQPSLRDDLVQPLDPKLAVIKDSYDPNTIARDVLIVANQHPTENCLNHHLIGLRRNIPAVKYSSDLESLRWDMIDPETPTSSVTANSTPPRLSSSMEQKVNIETHVLPDIMLFEDNDSHSSYPATPCPVEKSNPSIRKNQKMAAMPTNRQLASKATKPSAQSPPLSSFHHTPQIQVGLSKSPEEVTSEHFPRRSKYFEPKDKPKTIRQPAVEEHGLKCKWLNCHQDLPSKKALGEHVMQAHIMTSVGCGWDNCDCKKTFTAITLWHHVLGLHFPRLNE